MFLRTKLKQYNTFINELLLNLHHSECFPKGGSKKILFYFCTTWSFIPQHPPL